MARLTQMPLDVLDMILMFLPDFAGLRATAMASKLLYRAYAAWPTSIMKAVLRNLMGSDAVTAVALRAVRVELERGDENYAELKDALKRNTAENAISDPISWPEALELNARVRKCRWLEVLFSREYKDKLSGTESRLTQRESEAFNKALHRIWFFSDVLRTESGSNLWPTYEARKAWFYDDLSDQELYEFELLTVWLTTHLGQIEKETDSHKLLILDGVRRFRESYLDDDYDFEHVEEELINLEWREEFDSLWEERGVDRHIDDRSEYDFNTPVELPMPEGLTPLPEKIIGEDDICKKCRVTRGMKLWNCNNWQYMRALRDTRRLPDFWAGHLSSNYSERHLFKKHIDFHSSIYDGPESIRRPRYSSFPTSLERIRTPQILRAVFALPGAVASRQLQERLFKDDFFSIAKEDWLCEQCLKELLRQRLWIWWYNEKVLGRVFGAGHVQKNCRYGYECRAQGKYPEHATKFNHFWFNTAPEDDVPRPPRIAKPARVYYYDSPRRRHYSMYNPFDKDASW